MSELYFNLYVIMYEYFYPLEFNIYMIIIDILDGNLL